MWISLSWLRDHVDLGDRSAEEIAEDLTMKTALIEAVERRGAFGDHVVIGKVLDRRTHPNADRLSLCVVDVGDGDPVEIVCGAPNVAAGLTVAVAKVGAVLPGNFKIKKSKIRGVHSFGMICSEKELELGEDHDGIMELEEALEIGTPFQDVAGVADTLLEIDNKSVTHRPDLWGHEGFARELATIYGLETVPVALDESLAVGGGPAAVEIDAPDLCGRYHALFATGRFGGGSPGWMRRRLAHCGVRPISLAVDVSNYVMLDIGQPTHPFDRRTLRGDVIRVRRAAAGERLTTLDGEDRELPTEALVIADGERAVALAGIVGGQDSGIADDTTELVLESAWFEPIAVRRTATALALRTDALARFEKHLDPDLSERAVRRFASVLRQVDPEVEIAGEFVAAGEHRQEARRIALRPDRVRAKLGVDIETAEMERILTTLGFGVRGDGASLEVEVPTFRATRDVRIEDDLVEEVGRIHGYARIEPSLPAVACTPVRLEPENEASRRAGAALRTRLGFSEVLSYPFVDDDVMARSGVADAEALTLANPLQANARRLRRTLVPYMLEFVDRNVNAWPEVRLYECGRVFHPTPAPDALPEEPMVFAAVWAERATRPAASGRVLRALRGALEEVFEAVDRGFSADTVAPERRQPWMHPGRSAELLVGERRVGVLAQVHPTVAESFGWKGEVAVFEVDLSAVVSEPAEEREYRPLEKHPSSRLDVSYIAPFDVRFEQVIAALRKSSKRIVRIDFVDEYTGEGLDVGSRSMTIGLTVRAPDRTLAEDEIAAELANAREVIESLGGRLRG